MALAPTMAWDMQHMVVGGLLAKEGGWLLVTMGEVAGGQLVLYQPFIVFLSPVSMPTRI